MALVNFLKFSPDTGAIISDEEFWNIYFRKRMHGDNLHVLLEPEMSDALNMQVVYGGVGYPSVHHEVVQETRRHLAEKFAESGAEKLTRVKDIARIAFTQLQAAIRRRIDQKMQFYFGFNTDALNHGTFHSGERDIPIQNKKIKETARKLASRDTKDSLLKMAMDSKAAVFGYDTDGVTGYYLSSENSILGYVHEGFEAIGSGKYASGLVFGQDFKTKTLKMRQAGYAPAEGLIALIDSAFLASEHFKEVGGTLHFILLDRRAESPADRFQEVFDAPARLATEIVMSLRSGLLERSVAVKLIQKLIFEKASHASIESDLFRHAKDKVMLHFLLRRYKLRETEQLAQRIPEKDVFIPASAAGGEK